MIKLPILYIPYFSGYNIKYKIFGGLILKTLLVILFIILTILLLPIPLKITLNYSGKKAHIKIYGKEFNITRRIKKKIKKASIKTSEKIEEDIIHKDLVNPHNARKIITILRKNKFKLSLKVKFNINYALEDAAHTAILYGLLHQFTSFISSGLSLFFNLKDFKSEIKPTYNNFYFNFEINSIIFINFAKLIYICIIIIYNLKFGSRKLKVPKAKYKEEVQNG